MTLTQNGNISASGTKPPTSGETAGTSTASHQLRPSPIRILYEPARGNSSPSRFLFVVLSVVYSRLPVKCRWPYDRLGRRPFQNPPTVSLRLRLRLRITYRTEIVLSGISLRIGRVFPSAGFTVVLSQRPF